MRQLADLAVGCYTFSLKIEGDPLDPFDVCYREPTEAETARLAPLAKFKDPDGHYRWWDWFQSETPAETLPIAGDDPLAYLRLERFILHAPKPTPRIPDAQFDAIPKFFAPEVAILKLRAAAGRNDAAAYDKLEAETDKAFPEKWLDVRYARGLFAIHLGDDAMFKLAEDALEKEHHQWYRDLATLWNKAYPSRQWAGPW